MDLPLPRLTSLTSHSGFWVTLEGLPPSPAKLGLSTGVEAGTVTPFPMSIPDHNSPVGTNTSHIHRVQRAGAGRWRHLGHVLVAAEDVDRLFALEPHISALEGHQWG